MDNQSIYAELVTDPNPDLSPMFFVTMSLVVVYLGP